MGREKFTPDGKENPKTTKQIDNYRGLEVWISNDDYWVPKRNIAVHSFGLGSGKNRIFIRKEAYDLIQGSPRSSDFLQTIYDHEYTEFLEWKGEAKSPHTNGRNQAEQDFLDFLKDSGYYD